MPHDENQDFPKFMKYNKIWLGIEVLAIDFHFQTVIKYSNVFLYNFQKVLTNVKKKIDHFKSVTSVNEPINLINLTRDSYFSASGNNSII